MSEVQNPDLSIRNIIIFVLYSGVLIVMFVLLAKRQIRRMKLRYDKNFNTSTVKSFQKSYREQVQEKIEKATKPKYTPKLLIESERHVDESSEESKVRMEAMYYIDHCFQISIGNIASELVIQPEEGVCD